MPTPSVATIPSATDSRVADSTALVSSRAASAAEDREMSWTVITRPPTVGSSTRLTNENVTGRNESSARRAPTSTATDAPTGASSASRIARPTATRSSLETRPLRCRPSTSSWSSPSRRVSAADELRTRPSGSITITTVLMCWSTVRRTSRLSDATSQRCRSVRSRNTRMMSSARLWPTSSIRRHPSGVLTLSSSGCPTRSDCMPASDTAAISRSEGCTRVMQSSPTDSSSDRPNRSSAARFPHSSRAWWSITRTASGRSSISAARSGPVGSDRSGTQWESTSVITGLSARTIQD